MILKKKLNEKKHHEKIICHEVNSQMLWRGPLQHQMCNSFIKGLSPVFDKSKYGGLTSMAMPKRTQIWINNFVKEI
jgi:hypothetical protein